jgi:hypothetical protein
VAVPSIAQHSGVVPWPLASAGFPALSMTCLKMPAKGSTLESLSQGSQQGINEVAMTIFYGVPIESLLLTVAPLVLCGCQTPQVHVEFGLLLCSVGNSCSQTTSFGATSPLPLTTHLHVACTWEHQHLCVQGCCAQPAEGHVPCSSLSLPAWCFRARK